MDHFRLPLPFSLLPALKPKLLKSSHEDLIMNHSLEAQNKASNKLSATLGPLPLSLLHHTHISTVGTASVTIVFTIKTMLMKSAVTSLAKQIKQELSKYHLKKTLILKYSGGALLHKE